VLKEVRRERRIVRVMFIEKSKVSDQGLKKADLAVGPGGEIRKGKHLQAYREPKAW